MFWHNQHTINVCPPLGSTFILNISIKHLPIDLQMLSR